MSFSKLIFKLQKKFNGSVPVKYFYWPSESKSDKLIVMFSGFNGNEANGEPAYYNYVKSLSEVNCNRLFILDDYEGHPCYYLGKDGKLDYESAVVSIIHYIANQNDIPRSNIITCGSSKGGTAALYFGIKYNYGHVIAGGMQTKVGDYLYKSKYTRDVVLKLITGASDEKAKNKLNKYYEDLFETATWNTSLNFHVGSGDTTYENHIMPLLKILDKRNISYQLDVQDYSKHSSLGKFYPPFLLETLNKIL